MGMSAGGVPGSNGPTIQNQVYASTPVVNPKDRQGAENKQITEAKAQNDIGDGNNQFEYAATVDQSGETPLENASYIAGSDLANKSYASSLVNLQASQTVGAFQVNDQENFNQQFSDEDLEDEDVSKDESTNSSQESTTSTSLLGAKTKASVVQDVDTITSGQIKTSTNGLNQSQIEEIIYASLTGTIPSSSIAGIVALPLPKRLPSDEMQEIAAAFSTALANLNDQVSLALESYSGIQGMQDAANRNSLVSSQELSRVQQENIDAEKGIDKGSKEKEGMSVASAVAIGIGVALAVITLIISLVSCGLGAAVMAPVNAAVGAAAGAAEGAAAAAGAAGAAAGGAAAAGGGVTAIGASAGAAGAAAVGAAAGGGAAGGAAAIGGVAAGATAAAAVTQGVTSSIVSTIVQTVVRVLVQIASKLKELVQQIVGTVLKSLKTRLQPLIDKIIQVKDKVTAFQQAGKEIIAQKSPGFAKIMEIGSNTAFNTSVSIVLALPQLALGIKDLELSALKKELAGLQKELGELTAQASENQAFSSFWAQATSIASKQISSTQTLETSLGKTYGNLTKALQSIAAGMASPV